MTACSGGQTTIFSRRTCIFTWLEPERSVPSRPWPEFRVHFKPEGPLLLDSWRREQHCNERTERVGLVGDGHVSTQLPPIQKPSFHHRCADLSFFVTPIASLLDLQTPQSRQQHVYQVRLCFQTQHGDERLVGTQQS